MKPHKRKILLLDNGREWGGGTNSMLELLKRIDREKFEVTCCFYHNYSRGNGETIELILNSINVPVFFIPQIKQPRWAKISKEIIRTILFFSTRVNKAIIGKIDYKWRVLPNAYKINSLLQMGQYDALYMNNQPSTNVEGYIAARQLGIAIVQHCRIDPILNGSLVRMVNEHCDAIISVSNGVNSTLRQRGVDARRCFTVNNAIDIHQPLPDRLAFRRQLSLAPETFVFGSIGSLILRKSNHHILKALGHFKRKHPQANWRMIVVGSGPEHENLEKLAVRENISKEIIFTGFQNNALDFLSAFDTFILASKSEGLPRVVLEAMLVNTAVIGSNVTGTTELVNHNSTGLLFEYGDIDILTQHITLLWKEVELRQRLVDAAAKKVRENYAIENYVSGVESILEQVIRERKHA